MSVQLLQVLEDSETGRDSLYKPTDFQLAHYNPDSTSWKNLFYIVKTYFVHKSQ